MKTTRSVIVLWTLALLLPPMGVAHQESGLASTLERVLASHVQGYEDEDVERTLRDIHTKSPEYQQTRGALPAQFKAHDLQAQLVSFRLLGHDDELAVARAKVKVAGAPGSSFHDNVLDTITIFHQEAGTWKIWSDEALGVQFLAK
jgi:hypothetical protein